MLCCTKCAAFIRINHKSRNRCLCSLAMRILCVCIPLLFTKSN